MINELKDKFIQHFNKEVSKYEKENKYIFTDNLKAKLANSYMSTVLIEKDIEVIDWLNENIENILEIYKDEIIIKN